MITSFRVRSSRRVVSSSCSEADFLSECANSTRCCRNLRCSSGAEPAGGGSGPAASAASGAAAGALSLTVPLAFEVGRKLLDPSSPARVLLGGNPGVVTPLLLPPPVVPFGTPAAELASVTAATAEAANPRAGSTPGLCGPGPEGPRGDRGRPRGAERRSVLPAPRAPPARGAAMAWSPATPPPRSLATLRPASRPRPRLALATSARARSTSALSGARMLALSRSCNACAS
mmetsp:Transcript_926/g.2591  ORF Transcript_926/g.2591 Transcript_926/m.2591 type:complete len:231 (+) Transcript_926:482-1174(+)